jgi:hypothetical protein
MRLGPAAVLVACLTAIGCGTPARPPPKPKPKPAPVAEPERPMSMVTSAVIVDACPDWKRIDPARAGKEIEELVGPCSKVPGGAAHFSATLEPGGRVELASPSGDPGAGTVPTCVVQTARQLKHRIRLRSPCKFDVKLEERRDGALP